MTDRAIFAIWGSLTAMCAVVMGFSALICIYSPVKPLETPLQHCANWSEARNSQFCMKLLEQRP